MGHYHLSSLRDRLQLLLHHRIYKAESINWKMWPLYKYCSSAYIAIEVRLALIYFAGNSNWLNEANIEKWRGYVTSVDLSAGIARKESSFDRIWKMVQIDKNDKTGNKYEIGSFLFLWLNHVIRHMWRKRIKRRRCVIIKYKHLLNIFIFINLSIAIWAFLVHCLIPWPDHKRLSHRQHTVLNSKWQLRIDIFQRLWLPVFVGIQQLRASLRWQVWSHTWDTDDSFLFFVQVVWKSNLD